MQAGAVRLTNDEDEFHATGVAATLGEEPLEVEDLGNAPTVS